MFGLFYVASYWVIFSIPFSINASSGQAIVTRSGLRKKTPPPGFIILQDRLPPGRIVIHVEVTESTSLTNRSLQILNMQMGILWCLSNPIWLRCSKSVGLVSVLLMPKCLYKGRPQCSRGSNILLILFKVYTILNYNNKINTHSTTIRTSIILYKIYHSSCRICNY